jgi:cytoskeleton protein RodZ
MTSIEAPMETPLSPAAPAPAGPGASLKAARERAGLSLDQAAQALKLAPRQVKALEDEDFGQLPGRTFARGFVRNYARLVNLDGEALLAQLPDPSHAPALAAPSLHSTGTTIGEVPSARVSRSALHRWLVPVVLVTLIVGAGVYEWLGNRAAPARRAEPAPAESAVAPATPAPGSGTARTELPNPISAPAEPPASEAPPRAGAAAGPEASAQAAQGAAPGPSAPAAPVAQTAEAPSAPVATAATSAPAATAVADAPLVLTYRASSWTQVRDSRGQVLLNRIVPAGSEQPIRGTPPFEVTIGNARAVTVVYRGQEIDLGRYSRQNIARLRLP